LGIGPNPQSPIPNPQSPIPNPHFLYIFLIIRKINKVNINKKNLININNKMDDYYSAKSSIEIRAVPEREDPKIGNFIDDFFIQKILSTRDKNFIAKVK
jgi:hypothetical protein